MTADQPRQAKVRMDSGETSPVQTSIARRYGDMLKAWILKLWGETERRVRRWRVRRSQPATEDILPYRRFALRLLHGRGGAASMLMVSASRGDHGAQSCALLSIAIAGAIKTRILVLDISPAGSVLPMFLGCSRRATDSGPAASSSRSDRFYELDEGWYFDTREGFTYGPYASYVAAQQALDDYVLADLAERGHTEAESAIPLIQPTSMANVFYLSALSAGLRILHHGSDGDEASGPVRDLIDEIQKNYDYVMIFGGYLLDSATSLKVAGHVDSVVLASVENETTQGEYREALAILRDSSAEEISNLLVQVDNAAR